MKKYIAKIGKENLVYEIDGDTLACQLSENGAKLSVDLRSDQLKIVERKEWDRRFRSGLIISVIPLVTPVIIMIGEGGFDLEATWPFFVFAIGLLCGAYFIIRYRHKLVFTEVTVGESGVNIVRARNNAEAYEEFVESVKQQIGP